MPEPSKYQQAILDFVTDETGNGLISAVAGSGKTTTLVMLANAIPTDAKSVFLAFNKSIATELKQKLPGHVDSATFHSVCFRHLAKYLGGFNVEVDDQKTAELWDNFQSLDDTIAPMRSATLRLVGLAKSCAMMPDSPQEDWLGLVDHHGIDFAENADDQDPRDYTAEGVAIARIILAESNRDTKRIDFDDMLYLTAILGVPLTKYDYVLVDEAQDTNEVQRLLLKRMMGPQSRLIAVGDEYQAIYGFRGADSDAMALIERDFDCKRLPLSITYRCPQSVVDLAAQLVPHLEARPNAPQGTVGSPDSFALKSITPDDLIVCRNTAPLITLAYRCIGERVPVKIMGRDIGAGLVSLVKKLRAKGNGGAQIEDLRNKLDAYRQREVAAAMRQRKEAKAQSIEDKCTSLTAVLDGLSPDEYDQGVQAVIASINSIFTDKANGGKAATLATVHKAKGLEAQRVVILDPQLMPAKWVRQPWQQQQEVNLQYVAYTRSLDTLLLVRSDSITDGRS